METIWRDVRFAVRMLLKTPGFTVIAVLSLALGIGANTAVYSVIDAALMRQLPVERPEELVIFNWNATSTPPGSSHDGWMLPLPGGRHTTNSMTYPQFEAFRDQSDVFDSVFGFAEVGRASVTYSQRAELTGGIMVTGSYFSGLGLTPVIGRLLGPDDDRAGAAPAVVLSHGYWQRRFGGDVDVIGRPIGINGGSFSVVGVTPAAFDGTLQVGTRPDFYIPMGQLAAIGRDPSGLQGQRYWWLQVMGRLSPGVSLEQAESLCTVIFNRGITAEWGDTIEANPGAVPILQLTEGGKGLVEVRQAMSGSLFLAWAVCGVVLLIACANLAGLLLARSGSRRREIAVRMSIGASRVQLVRQLLTESLLLSGAGAALGLVLAVFGVETIYGLFPQQMGSEIALNPQVNARVLAFTAGAAILTGLLFGLAPALRASSLQLTSALKDPGQGSGSRGGRLAGRALLVAQVAFSLVLLVMAGLFSRTLVNLNAIDPGFNASGLLLFRVDPTLSGYEGEKLVDLYRRMQTEITALPGVDSATLSPFSLIAGRGSWRSLTPPEGPQDVEKRVHVHTVAPNFLETMQIPLAFGRNLDRRDGASAPRVAVVNETFAREMFSTVNPVGRRFGFGDTADIEIVGLSRDAKNHSLRDGILPTVYLPYEQGRRLRSMTFSVRTHGEPEAMIGTVRELLRGIDPNLPLFEVKTLADQIEETLLQERQFAKLGAVLGSVALALSCIGLYGLLSHVVLRRTREFGIRRALGARRGDVVTLIMREMRLVGLGTVLGIALALGAARSIGAMLYGLEAIDPLSIAGATIVLMAVSAVAAYIPARRAGRTDPLVALRSE